MFSYNRGPYSPGGGNGSAAAVAAVAAAVGGEWSGKPKKLNFFVANRAKILPWIWIPDQTKHFKYILLRTFYKFVVFSKYKGLSVVEISLKVIS